MPSVSRASGVSPTASVSYPAPGTVNKGSGVSNGGSSPSGPQNVQTDAGVNVITDAGVQVTTSS